jgi:hypothetical protein
MAYLSFDLEALDALPDIARSAGISEAEVAYGLLRLWRHAWKEKTENILPVHLIGFFNDGDSARIRAALEAFGFIAEVANGTIRVRGAERYLRISKARAEAGKARAAAGARASTGRLVAGEPTSTQPANAGGATSNPPAANQLLHRAPITEHLESTPRARAKTEPAPLIERLAAIFLAARGAEYVPTFPDEQALRPLLTNAKGSEEEIARRWGIALARQRFPQCNSLADLAKHWNAYAAPETAVGPPQPPPKPPPNPNRKLGVVENLL